MRSSKKPGTSQREAIHSDYTGATVKWLIVF